MPKNFPFRKIQATLNPIVISNSSKALELEILLSEILVSIKASSFRKHFNFFHWLDNYSGIQELRLLQWRTFDSKCLEYAKQYSSKHKIDIDLCPSPLLALIIMINFGFTVFTVDCVGYLYFRHCFDFACQYVPMNLCASVSRILCEIIMDIDSTLRIKETEIKINRLYMDSQYINKKSSKMFQCSECVNKIKSCYANCANNSNTDVTSEEKEYSDRMLKNIGEILKVLHIYFFPEITNPMTMMPRDVYFGEKFGIKKINIAYNLWASSHCDNLSTTCKECPSEFSMEKYIDSRIHSVCHIFATLCNKNFAICGDFIDPYQISHIIGIFEIILQVHELHREAFAEGSLQNWYYYRRYLDSKCMRIVRAGLTKFDHHWKKLKQFCKQQHNLTNIKCNNDKTYHQWHEFDSTLSIIANQSLNPFQEAERGSLNLALSDSGVESWHRLFYGKKLIQILVNCGFTGIMSVLQTKNKSRRLKKIALKLKVIQEQAFPKIVKYLNNFVIRFIEPLIEMIEKHIYLVQAWLNRQKALNCLKIAIFGHTYIGNHDKAVRCANLFKTILYDTSAEWNRVVRECKLYDSYCKSYNLAHKIIYEEKRAFSTPVERLTIMILSIKLSNHNTQQVAAGQTFSKGVLENVLVKQGLKNLSMIKECYYCREKSKKLKLCKRCRKAKYCSKNCQKNDWNLRNHKHECVKFNWVGIITI